MTDIAHYMARTIPFLSEYFKIRLWVEQDDWDRDIENHCEVVRYNIARFDWGKLNEAEITIYHIGNNPDYHRSTWEISCKHSGVVVLHDAHLQHFFAGIFRYQTGDISEYRRMFLRLYGAVGLTDLDRYLNDQLDISELSDRYPMTEAVTENALSVVTHNISIHHYCRYESFKSCCYVPLPFRMADELGVKKGRDSDICEIVVFGYIGTNRRVGSLLDALAGVSGKSRYRLKIFGKLFGIANDIKKQIEELGLEDIVEIHGFVPEKVLDGAIQSCDVAVNLRYPTMGEASGSQLRIWNHGKPALVTDAGWYKELPSDSVFHISSGEGEVRDIRRVLELYFRDKELFRQKGLRGYEHLKSEHQPDSYAKQFANFVMETINRPRHIDYCAQKLSDVAVDILGDGSGKPLFSTVVTQQLERVTGY